MGYLMIDHRGTVDAAGEKDGRLEEWDTVSCRHCQGLIKIFVRGCARAAETKHSCDRCRGPICKACAAAMHQSRICPGPVKAQIERWLRNERAGERITVALRG